MPPISPVLSRCSRLLVRALRLSGRSGWSALWVVAPIAAVAFGPGPVAHGAEAPIAFVQGQYAVPQGAHHTVNVSFGSAQAAGNLNVVVVGWSDSTARVKSVRDSRGRAYARAVGPTIVSGSLSQSIYYARNIRAGATTITVRFNRAAIDPDVRVVEYSGLHATRPLVGASAASGTGTLSSSGPVTLAFSSGLLVAANTVREQTTGAGAGYTTRMITAPNGDVVADRTIAAPGTYAATASLSGGPWVMQLAAFQAATSVPSPPLAPTVTLTASPLTVTAGGSATVTWSSTNATSCTASGGWSGAKAISGSQGLSGLAETAEYALTCAGPGGLVAASVTITVLSPPPPPPVPTVTLNASLLTVLVGGSTTLTWSSTNAASCTTSGGWSGAKAVSGSQGLSGLTETLAYALTCAGPGGSASASVTIAVLPLPPPPPAPTVTLAASPLRVPTGGASTLTWSSTNATSCTAGGGWSGPKVLSGSQILSGLAATASYTLACTGAAGSAGTSVTITVSVPRSVTLTWTDNSGGTAGTYIDRKEGGATLFTRIDQQAAGSSTYVDTTALTGLTYCYRVHAFDDASISSYSNEACEAP